MAERLIQEGMRLRSLEAAAGEGRCGCARATRYSPATCFRIAIISLSSSMHSSSVISMPQFARIAGSFAHVTLSPCTPDTAPGVKLKKMLNCNSTVKLIHSACIF